MGPWAERYELGDFLLQEFNQGILVNTLGYVGSLFIKDQAGIETTHCIGPMNLLREVSVHTDEDTSSQSSRLTRYLDNGFSRLKEVSSSSRPSSL